MDRRKAIINMSLGAAGISLSSAFISALGSCGAKKELNYQALIFTSDQDALVQVLVEHIIPTTDTPGAIGAGVNQYIDKVLAMVNDEGEKAIFLEGLEELGSEFLTLSADKQIEVLKKQESDGSPFFGLLKSMTIYGYYTSEIGASQELAYVHATGSYRGDVPYNDIGKNYF